jgi:hypothetical protein
MGWSIIGVTVFNIVTNMFVMFYTSIRMLRLFYLRIKFKYLKWKIEKQQKYPEESQNNEEMQYDARSPTSS